MQLAKVKEFLSPSNLILLGLFLIALFVALRHFHPILLDCSGYIGDPQTLGLILAHIDAVFELLMPIAFIGMLLGIVSTAIGICLHIERHRSVWVITGTVIVVLVFLFVAGSILLASLNTARNKGPNAGIKAYIASIRSEGEAYVAARGNYGLATDSCVAADTLFTTAVVQKYIQAAEKDAGQSAECRSNGMSFVIAIPLLSQGSRDAGLFCKIDLSKRPRWCIDSAGNMREIASLLEGYSCPERIEVER